MNVLGVIGAVAASVQINKNGMVKGADKSGRATLREIGWRNNQCYVRDIDNNRTVLIKKMSSGWVLIDEANDLIGKNNEK